MVSVNYIPRSSFILSLSACGRLTLAPGLGGAHVQVESSSFVKNSGSSFLAILYGLGAFEAVVSLAMLTLMEPTVEYCTLKEGEKKMLLIISNSRFAEGLYC